MAVDFFGLPPTVETTPPTPTPSYACTECENIYVNVCVRVCVCVCMCMCVCVVTCVFMYVCARMCVYERHV